MAAGLAGDTAIPVPTIGDTDEVPNMRAPMKSMVDALTALQNQMTALMEDLDQYLRRSLSASTGDRGPAVRERVYSHAQQSDRMKMNIMEEVTNKNTSRLDDLEASFVFYSSELTGDRDEISKTNDALRDLRNDTSPTRSTGTGDRRD